MDSANTDLNLECLLDPATGHQYLSELREKLSQLINSEHTIDSIKDKLLKLYPQNGAIEEALADAERQRSESALKPSKVRNNSSSSGASFTGALHNITSFAVAKVSNLATAKLLIKTDSEVDKFKSAFIESIIGQVIRNAWKYVKGHSKTAIIGRDDIRTSMHAILDLVELFLSDDRSPLLMNKHHPVFAHALSSMNNFNQSDHSQELSTSTYKKKVRHIIDSENSFIRGLKLIIMIFKAQLYKFSQLRRDVDILFCNIEDLLELSIKILTACDDALESIGQTDDDIPFIGAEMLELAQTEEFHVYFNFAYRRLSKGEDWNAAFKRLTFNEVTMSTLRTVYTSFDLAFQSLLPNLLLNTIVQFFEYYKNFNDLYELSKLHHNQEDRLALKETISIMLRTKKAIEGLLEAASKEDFGVDIYPLDAKAAEAIRGTLERKLDAKLELERNEPLPFMPPPEMYRFSEPDSKDNIQFEEFSNHRTISSKDLDGQSRTEVDHVPVIKCATLIKLVERLTYHKYQPNIVDSFLTTYRSFISDPEELLDLLIERYRIPDPPVYVVCRNNYGQPDDLTEIDRAFYRSYLKRFKQEYTKPVKMRVINVLKSWIKNHYYDFERRPSLLDKLDAFLDEIYNNDKVLRSLVVSIRKLIHHKRTSQSNDFEFMPSKEPPPILWWIAGPNEYKKFDILTLHPIEFARQLTLIEFDLFRAIKPSELIDVRDLGVKSRKDDKYESSPNLRKMTRHFTLISYWVRKCIVETEDFDKRSAIYNRSVEIMGVLRELNNFSGLLSIGSAIESAPIMRLSHTCKTLSSVNAKILDDYRELNENHQQKLQRDLKKCNPPCIPYLGSYQTKLIHAKEGNKTFIDDAATSPTLSNEEFQSLSNSPSTPISPRTPLPRYSTLENQFFATPKMINFTKQRIRAGLVAEISNYQNPPYSLHVQPEIRHFIEFIDSQVTEFASTLKRKSPSCNQNGSIEDDGISAITKYLDDYLFEQSEKIEPKNCIKPLRSKSKLPDCWKSPGIKPASATLTKHNNWL